MDDKDIEKYCDKAFTQFKEECLKEHCIPIMLMAAEVDTDNAQVFNLCSKKIPCEEMIRCLHEATKSCQKEIIARKYVKNELN
jgi:hypothetical protein